VKSHSCQTFCFPFLSPPDSLYPPLNPQLTSSRWHDHKVRFPPQQFPQHDFVDGISGSWIPSPTFFPMLHLVEGVVFFFGNGFFRALFIFSKPHDTQSLALFFSFWLLGSGPALYGRPSCCLRNPGFFITRGAPLICQLHPKSHTAQSYSLSPFPFGIAVGHIEIVSFS